MDIIYWIIASWIIVGFFVAVFFGFLSGSNLHDENIIHADRARKTWSHNRTSG